MKNSFLLVGLCLLSSALAAQDAASPAKIPLVIEPIPSDKYFKKSLEINNTIRTKHLIDIGAMQEMLMDKDTVLLDVRGDSDYKDKQIQGAMHLSLADITPKTLAKAIPSKDTRVILYCDAAMVPYPTRRVAVSTQAYPLIYQHGYTRLYEIKQLWSSKGAPDRKEYEDYLKMNFEGNPVPIAYDRKYVENCLSAKPDKICGF